MALNTTVSLSVSTTGTSTPSSVETIGSTVKLGPINYKPTGSDVVWTKDITVGASSVTPLDLTALAVTGGANRSFGHVQALVVQNKQGSAAQDIFLDGGTNVFAAPWPGSSAFGVGVHIESIPAGAASLKANTLGAGWATGSSSKMVYVANATASAVNVTVLVLGTVA